MNTGKVLRARFLSASAMLFLLWTAGHTAESEKERQLATLVDQAVQLIHTEGDSAFKRFGTRGTMWREGDTYIFVGDTEGNILFNGGDRSLEGQNLLDSKDANGKLFIQAFIDTVTTQGSGWVDYMWPKPGRATPARKMSYLREAKLGEKTLFVGAGFYSE